MSVKKSFIFKVMHILIWIVFLGLCIKTGSLLFNLIFSLFINPIAANDLYLGLNLSDLLEYSRWNYASLLLLFTLIWGFKAYLFYWIIKLIEVTKIDAPFTKEVAKLISKLGFISLGISVVSIFYEKYSIWLSGEVPALLNQQGTFGGGAEFLFTTLILFTIAHVFKKGVELQSENELTI